MSPEYPELAEWLNDRISKLHLDNAGLNEITGIPKPTLRAYRTGKRRPTKQIGALAQVLALPGEPPEVTADAIRTRLVKTKAFDLTSEQTSLTTMTLPYAPFANGKNMFIDRFFERFFRLSVIRSKPNTSVSGFSLRERVDKLNRGEYDVATNLLGTLQLLKTLRYYWIPARISLGAVCMRRHLPSLHRISRAIAFRAPRGTSSLWPIVVDLEVGAVHVRQSLGMDLKDPRHFVDDIDPGKLAVRLQEQDAALTQQTPCVITDEVTALRVARVLGDKALIVLPLSTAQSVQMSEARREMPAHVLGAAISRTNEKLRGYMDDAWPALLHWEPETIATEYAKLFSDLVTEVTECLAEGVTVADVDSDYGYVDLRILLQTDADQAAKRAAELFVYRTSRAFARRALQIDQRSIESFMRGDSIWRDVLEKSRAKVLVQEADDRRWVRDRVTSALERAFGKTFVNRLEQLEASEVFPVLEQEFDISLDRGFWDAKTKTVEPVVSKIQKQMEGSSPVALQTNIVAVEGGDPAIEESLADLKRRLEKELWDTLEIREDTASESDRVAAFVAVYRGRFVGCVELFGCEGESGAEETARGKTLRLRNLYVLLPFRKQRVARLLVRRAIDFASQRHDTSITIDMGRMQGHPGPESPANFFQKIGFQPDQGILRYSLA